MQPDEYRRKYYGEFPYPCQGDNEEVDTHQEDCSVCHGAGTVLAEPVSIQRICSKCKGRGSIDWIDHMTGNPSPHEISRNFAMSVATINIERLIVLMKQIMAGVGEDIRVSVSLEHREFHGSPRGSHNTTKWIDS